MKSRRRKWCKSKRFCLGNKVFKVKKLTTGGKPIGEWRWFKILLDFYKLGIIDKKIDKI